MTRIYTLFELYEPAFVLDGQLVDGDCPVIRYPLVPEFTGPADDESRAEWLKVVRYFTRLRTATEVRAALDDLGADEEDIEALVDAGALIAFPPTRWLDWPDSEWEQHAWLIGALIVLHLAPLAPLQSYGPDGVALALPDRDDRVAVIDRFSVEMIRDAMREPRIRLGLALERAAALQGWEREKAWRRLGADLGLSPNRSNARPPSPCTSCATASRCARPRVRLGQLATVAVIAGRGRDRIPAPP